LTFILPVQAEFRRGCAAFDSGRYAEAKEFFRQMINPDAPDPYSVYNFGCPLYMLGDYPRATLAFEQALLLAPGDARLKSAYRDALAKLPGAPEKSDGSFTEFVLSLRDNFRPDQYLLAASVLFAVLGAVALCRKLPGRKWSLFTLALLIAVMIIAAWSQSLHRYAPDRARIVAASAELHRLPADSGSVAGIIPGGSEVKIAERNGSWVRIIMPGSPGGWVKSDEVREIFKHGVW
jgi:tetratricopeptide (TPR) repeat protein